MLYKQNSCNNDNMSAAIGGYIVKRIFIIAIGILLSIILLLVGFGAFLNYKDENNIAKRMTNRVLHLHGARVQERELQNSFVKESLRLSVENMTDAVSRMEGTVAEVYVEPNQVVKKGQPLCRIISEDIDMRLAQADVNIAKAEALRIRYEHAYERYQRLVDMDAVSKEQYDDAVANYKSAIAEVKVLKLEKQQYEILKDRLTVTAPIDGEVLMLYKKPGSFLQAGASVALIGNFAKMSFKESVSEAELRRLIYDNSTWQLHFSKSDLSKIYSGQYGVENKGAAEAFNARITRIDPPMAVAAAMRTVEWEVDNESGILEPKRYQDVAFKSQERHKALSIPIEAFVGDDMDTVYVAEKGVLKQKLVEIGIVDQKYCEIVSGLEPGEVVIVSGKEGLKEGMNVEVNIEEDKANGQ